MGKVKMSKLKVGINIQIIDKERLPIVTEDVRMLVNDITEFLNKRHFCLSGQTQKNINTNTTYMYFAFDGHDSKEWKVDDKPI